MSKSNSNFFGYSFIVEIVKQFKWQLLITMGVFIITSLLLMLIPYFTQIIVDIGIVEKNINLLLIVSFTQVIILLTADFLYIIQSWLITHLGLRINIKIIEKFIWRFLNIDYSSLKTKSKGALLQKIYDAEDVEEFMTNDLILFICTIFNLMFFGLLMFMYKTSLLYILIILIIYKIGYAFFILNKQKVLNYKEHDIYSQDHEFVIQMVEGTKEIKLQNLYRYTKKGWDHLQLKIFEVQKKITAFNNHKYFMQNSLIEIVNILFVSYTAWLVIENHLTIGMMVAVQYIFRKVIIQSSILTNTINKVYNIKYAFNRMNNYISESIEVNEESEYKTLKLDKQFEIKVEQLSFIFPDSSEYLMTNLSFNIPPKKISCIIAKSGFGKTTLLQILLGLYPNYKGNITISGVNLKDIDINKWRHHVGAVLQDSHIFPDTIKGNIVLDKECNDDRLNEILEMVNLDTYINSLPLKTNTKIDKNIKISDGQKQRILLARNLYKKPKFLILDEALNNLDIESKNIILKVLTKLKDKITILIVSHDLDVVKIADVIYELDHNSIVKHRSCEDFSKKYKY